MRRVHDLRRRDNVFVAIVLLCQTPYINTHVVLANRIVSGELRGVSGCSSRGNDFFAVETGKARLERFWRDVADGALESPRRPDETENPYQFS